MVEWRRYPHRSTWGWCREFHHFHLFEHLGRFCSSYPSRWMAIYGPSTGQPPLPAGDTP
ncbi:hypothetical protein NSU_2088 [Novosphingobium pentaromativorans US6-1]|uniref:Uncharacterized protein n=1 Tax=Novosphingobium pentaromativorans US6-1 TaxID=1088721 RepID=G6ECL8_9SPHN|nr:hypothetical protein NSU_2088 [Novosphingobium pentaromativorans US6-1]